MNEFLKAVLKGSAAVILGTASVYLGRKVFK